MDNLIKQRLVEHQSVLQDIINDDALLSSIQQIVDVIVTAYRNKHKMLLCGNGGSAADAQHIAAEFVSRFYLERQPLPAIALHTNTSALTAIANDDDYKYTYSKLVKAFGEPGDVLIAISTSGNSENVIAAVNVASTLGLTTVGLLGKDGGKLAQLCDITLVVPSHDTPRIQEMHITIGHIVCELVEKILFDND